MATIANTPKTPTIDATVDAEVGTLTLTFSDGRRLDVDTNMLSTTIRAAAMLHGLKQKLVDAAAILRNPETGRSATLDDKYDAVREVYDRITAPEGTWNKVRGDGTVNNSGLLIRALMAVYNKDRATIEAKLATCSDDEKKALRGLPVIAAKMAELKAASTTVDTDALLSKFSM